jgi:hypothetical protein
MSPLPAARALEQYFLDARCRLLDLAAILDRIGRGDDDAGAVADPRLKKIHEAMRILLDTGDGRADRIQKLFSLEYDSDWKKPQPRY